MSTHDSLTVIVFAKPPRAGASKTRLARRIGDDHATRLAAAFVHDSLHQLARFRDLTRVLATTEPWPEDRVVLPEGMEVWQQGPGDLGDRLERMMFKALQSTQTAIALGADTPGLPEKMMLEAVHALQRSDAVLGPSRDGGFYLLGLRRCPPGLFVELPWSTPRTMAATEDRLRSYRLTVERVSPWFDVDTLEDLVNLRALLERGVIHAPETWETLKSIGALPPIES